MSLTVWLISLSIMLSSSIHAVAKDISSVILSNARGEWEEDSEGGDYRNYYKGHVDKIKGEGGGGEGR